VGLVFVACGPADGGTDADHPAPFEYDYVAHRPRGPLPHFSFFVTSLTGLFGLGDGPWGAAPDDQLGFGGNLGGLSGADAICSALAQRGNPGDTKVWRAFLSSSEGHDRRIDAIDRIGRGPWFDHRGLKLADNVAGLMPADAADGRPSGATPELAAMFTVETGERVRSSTQIDNHDVLTGSNRQGRLFDDGEEGRIATCDDWTSTSVRGTPGNGFGDGGQVPVGHSWPRSDFEGRNWIDEHSVNGCEPGVDTDGSAGAPRDNFTVGAAGGYGGFYCFALNATTPTGSIVP